MRKTGGAAAAGGSAAASALAVLLSLCCGAPGLVALFGVSGAVAFARLEPLRPYLLIAAGLLLAWAFWRVYGRRKTSQCDCRRPSILSKALIWVSAALWLLAFWAPRLPLIFAGPV
jgi:hypothetical protein